MPLPVSYEVLHEEPMGGESIVYVPSVRIVSEDLVEWPWLWQRR